MSTRTILNPREFAEAIGKSLKIVYRRLKAGHYPAEQPGGEDTAWFIDLDAFRARLAGAASSTECPTMPEKASAGLQRLSGTTPFPTRTQGEIEERISGPQPKWLQPPIPKKNKQSKRSNGTKKT